MCVTLKFISKREFGNEKYISMDTQNDNRLTKQMSSSG